MELDANTNASGVKASGQRTGGIETGLMLSTKVRCRQHDMQQVSRLVPGGPFDSLPVFASTLQEVDLETG